MHQGDQYALRINVRGEGLPVTPDEVEGVKVKIGSVVRRYPDGGLTYDDTLGSWLFSISQEETLALDGIAPAQVQVNYGGTPAQIVSSDVVNFDVKGSIIKEFWDD